VDAPQEFRRWDIEKRGSGNFGQSDGKTDKLSAFSALIEAFSCIKLEEYTTTLWKNESKSDVIT